MAIAIGELSPHGTDTPYPNAGQTVSLSSYKSVNINVEVMNDCYDEITFVNPVQQIQASYVQVNGFNLRISC